MPRLQAYLVLVTAYRCPMPTGEMPIWCRQATTEVDMCLDKLSPEPGVLQLVVAYAFTFAILTDVRQLNDTSRRACWLCSVVSRGGAARPMIR